MDILNKFLTVILFLNCLFMILLVLVQLPKKEAGLGTAFGGGATDALFGAGAGNVLTKLTKWCAVLFLVLCLALSLPFMSPIGLQEGESSSINTGGAKPPSQNGPGQTPGTIPAITTNTPPVKPATPSAPAPKKPGEEKDKVPGPDKK
jgi:preprotein translocase subunit SecG